MQSLSQKLDAVLASSPSVALAVAVSIRERCCILQRSRADLEPSPLFPPVAPSDAEHHSMASGAQGVRSVSLPPPQMVEMYVALAAQCAIPFLSVDTPHAAVEWSVLRFHLPQWDVVAFRDTVTNLCGAQADAAATLDFLLLVFTRTAAGDDEKVSF